LPNISVGNHAYEKKGAEETALAVCQQFYKQGTICPGNDTFDIDPEIVTGDESNLLYYFFGRRDPTLTDIFLVKIQYCTVVSNDLY